MKYILDMSSNAKKTVKLTKWSIRRERAKKIGGEMNALIFLTSCVRYQPPFIIVSTLEVSMPFFLYLNSVSF